MKRSGAPLRRYTELRRKTALKRESKRHAREQRQLDAAKAIVQERSQGRCEAHPVLGWCDTRAQHFHHVLRRTQGGTHTPTNLLNICAEAHDFVHTHPAEAEKLGLLQRSVGAATVTVRQVKDGAA